MPDGGLATADIPPAPGLLAAGLPPPSPTMGMGEPLKSPDLALQPSPPSTAPSMAGGDVNLSQRPPLSTASGPTRLGNAIANAQGPLTPELGRRSGVRPEYVPIINWIAAGESHGYDELYNGGHFSDMSDHPSNLGWRGDRGPDGRHTSAAGLLQWEQGTWNEARDEYNQLHPNDQVHDFSDVSQNKVGQYWIEKTYRERTGRDIVGDLYAGKTDQLIPALKAQWPSLGKGDSRDQTRYAGMEALGPLNEEQRRLADASISQLERDRSAILDEASRAPVGSAERMQMLHEAHEHSHELTKLYEDKIKNPPEKKPADVFAGWGGIAIALAALAGRRSAQPLTGSLNAMAGAMDAMNQGNYRDYEDRMKIWDKQSGYALKAIEIQNQEIREILEDQRTSEAEKQARLSTLYHVSGMDQQIALQRSGQIKEERTNLWQMMEWGDKLRSEKEKTDQYWANFVQRERLAGDRSAPEQKFINAGLEAARETDPDWTSEKEAQKRLELHEQYQRATKSSPAQQQNIKLYEELEAAQTPEEKKAAQQRIDDWNRTQGKGVSASRSAIGAMRAALTKEHPDWDESQMEDALLEYHRLSSIESGFGGGVLGRNVVSLNTVADHAMRVREYFEALDNGQIPRANRIANAISKESGGPEVTDFNTGATIMTGEVTRLLTTTGGAEGDRERMLSLITPIMSKAQGRGALNVFDDMINARFDSLRTQFAAGRVDRAEKFDRQLLSPEAKKLHERTLERQKPQDAAGGAGLVIKDVTEEQYDRLPGGAWYTMPGDAPGSHRVKP